MKLKLAALLLLFSFNATAADFAVDPAQSSIAFSGTHVGNKFTGKFEKWDATIKFDPANLATSKIEVTIDTTSAKTGNSMYDGTLPTADWFDVKKFPQAKYVSTDIRKNEDGSFTAKGDLTIRDKTQSIMFTFKLPADLKTAPITTSFSLPLDRIALGLGATSDAKAEWVGKDITLDVNISAKPI